LTGILLIGFGNMGRIHARVLQKLDMLSCIVEPFVDNAKLAKANTKVQVYNTIDEAVKSEKNIDGIVIAVPTRFHYNLFTEAVSKISNLKGILLEKPMAESVEQCLDLMNKYSDWKSKTIIGHIEVYNPVVTKFFDLLKNTNEFGAIRTIAIYRRGAVPEKRLSSLSGILEDIGVHDFDILSRIIQGEITLSCTGTYRQDSLNSAIISFKDTNIHGFIHLSREFAGKERILILECENATIIMDLIAQSIEIRSLQPLIGGDATITIPTGPGTTIKVYGEPLQEEILNLKGIIRDNDLPIVSMDHGLNAMKIVEACEESLKTGSAVKIELV
jgi:UDP-N-acetylglucosamine 3-dehydrogenase